MDRTSGPRGLNLTLEFFKPTIDSNFIIGGYNPSLGLASYAMKIKASGDSLWFRKLSHNNHGFPNDGHMQWVSQTSDSGFAFAGYFIDNSLGGNGANGWLVKTDKHGCYEAGCQNISLAEFDDNKTEFNLYPNPANEDLIISSSKSPFSYKIYSITGEKVLEGESLTAKKELDISQLPSGTYAVWIGDHEKGNTKIFVIK